MKIGQRRTTAELSPLDMQTLVWRMLPIFPWSKLLAEHIVLTMSLEMNIDQQKKKKIRIMRVILLLKWGSVVFF